MKVSELGEFGLIRRIIAAGPVDSEDVVVGPGDDGAVWRVRAEPPAYVVATTDTLVEGVHFLAGATRWEDVGYKALAVNASDVFAMGGEPLFALVTLGIPPEMEVEDVDAVYRGLREGAFGSQVIGGDIVRCDRFFVTVALLGAVGVKDGQPLLLRRDRARAGDAIAVTGVLGDSAGGLRLLAAGGAGDNPLVRAHLRPSPPQAAAEAAVRLGLACAIDVSDGLLQDVGHVCEMSGTGAVLQAAAIPVSEALRSAFPDETLRLACTGGEDYELVLVGPAEVLRRVEGESGVRTTIIGEMTEGPAGRVCLVDEAGREIEFEGSGWDHLRATPAKGGA